MKKRLRTKEFRIIKYNKTYYFAEVFYDGKNKIQSYSDIVIPTAKNVYDLKILLTKLLTATRKDALMYEDLKKESKNK